WSVRMGMNRMVLAGTLVTSVGLGLLLAVTLAGLHHAVVFFGLIVSVGLGNGMTLPNANAGMLSIKPQLAGTASGLGGAITIGGGAMMAGLAGALLVPGAGELPLIAIMLASSLASLVAIAAVIRRARRLGLAG
ncbi:MAG: Bcr/CflA family drug resistance efflux transporter, partial [Pseudorhodobacter sp.]|nr:Bcr/CflA family drug resistance efflux transporter [Pseudorhodobacter sp.]